MTDDIKEVRIPVRFTKSAHPALVKIIDNTPKRYRSERIRSLIEKGILYEEQSYLLQYLSESLVRKIRDPDSQSMEDSRGAESITELTFGL